MTTTIGKRARTSSRGIATCLDCCCTTFIIKTARFQNTFYGQNAEQRYSMKTGHLKPSSMIGEATRRPSSRCHGLAGRSSPSRIRTTSPQVTGLLSSAARRLRELHNVYKIEYDLVSQSKDDDHLLEHFKKSRDTRSKVDILETFAGQANISRRSGQFGLSAAAPIDYATGWDLQKTAHQQEVEWQLDQLKPLILIQGIDCRDWCILQDNTNYVRRKILLLMRRAKARRLLKKVCQWWVPQASG